MVPGPVWYPAPCGKRPSAPKAPGPVEPARATTLRMTPIPAISLAGLRDDDGAPWHAGAVAAFAWAARHHARAVQLDLTWPDLRPRTLDRSARRGLAATLRRASLECAGADLWIPPEHFTDARHVDRAVDAVAHAAGLIAELAPLLPTSRVVSLLLPAETPPGVRRGLAAAAEASGVVLADHAVPSPPADAAKAPGIVAGPALDAGPAFGLGLDPAALLFAGVDPVALAARVAPAAARLSDAGLNGRVTPGEPGGRLDVTAYLITLALAPHLRSVVVDLRGLRDQPAAAEAGVRRVRDATAFPAPPGATGRP